MELADWQLDIINNFVKLFGYNSISESLHRLELDRKTLSTETVISRTISWKIDWDAQCHSRYDDNLRSTSHACHLRTGTDISLADGIKSRGHARIGAPQRQQSFWIISVVAFAFSSVISSSSRVVIDLANWVVEMPCTTLGMADRPTTKKSSVK